MSDAQERIWAWTFAGGWNRGEWTGQKAYSDSVEYIRADLATLSDAVAEREADPVAWPRIMYVCEYCQEYNPEMCGHDRSDLYVSPDGRWLCEGCINEAGVPVSECSSPPPLYTSPPTSELEELRKRVAELEKALDALLERWSKFEASCGNQEEAYYKLVKYARPAWEAARRVREGGKAE